MVLTAFLLAAAGYDLREQRIPDWLCLSGMVLAVWLTSKPAEALLSGAVALVAMLALAAILASFFGPDALGGGDVKGIAVLAMFLGLQATFLILAVAWVMLGLWCVLRRHPTRLVPLMPFVSLGTGLWALVR